MVRSIDESTAESNYMKTLFISDPSVLSCQSGLQETVKLLDIIPYAKMLVYVTSIFLWRDKKHISKPPNGIGGTFSAAIWFLN